MREHSFDKGVVVTDLYLLSRILLISILALLTSGKNCLKSLITISKNLFNSRPAVFLSDNLRQKISFCILQVGSHRSEKGSRNTLFAGINF